MMILYYVYFTEKSFEWSEEEVKVGDTIGCQVIFPDKSDKLQMALVKFFVNGVFVYKEVIGINPSGLFVALCFESEGKSLEIELLRLNATKSPLFLLCGTGICTVTFW